jgi:hypothetical protein
VPSSRDVRWGQRRSRAMPGMEPYLGNGLVSATPSTRLGLRHFRRPDGAALESVRRSARQQVTNAQQRIPGLLQDIADTALASDPLLLYSRLHVMDAMRRATVPGHIGFGTDALLEFYAGLVTAMPVEEVLDRLGTDNNPQGLYSLDGLLREYGLAENIAHQGAALGEGGAEALTRVRHLLQFEHRFDRMLGYPAQLRPIFDAVAAPIAAQAVKTLGFSLDDALTAAGAYHEMLADRVDAAGYAFEDGAGRYPPPAGIGAKVQFAAGIMAGIATFGAAPVEEDLPGLLADATGLSRERLAAVLAALTTPLGSQPDLHTISDNNTLRRRPVIGLPDGRLLWARPGDFLHTALDWAADVCQGTSLMEAFDRRRQDACVELTQAALASIFGHDQVHAEVTYPADGQRPDIDVLVATPGATIAVEVKGGRFTDPARRAAPDRVKKKVGEFVEKALAQNARTIAHLRVGGVDLRDKKGRRLDVPISESIVSIIVTLERVDPFATHLPVSASTASGPEGGTWLVTVADLLMVADMLRHPAEFYAYAQTRAMTNKLGGPKIFVEADALGLWCEQRFRATEPASGELVLLDTTSETMNAYYTHVPTMDHDRPVRPSTGVPAEVLAALDLVLQVRPHHWSQLATSVLEVTPRGWRSVQRALKRPHEPAVKPTRNQRRRARRATDGIRLSSKLTIFTPHEHSPEQPMDLDATSLVVVPALTDVQGS